MHAAQRLVARLTIAVSLLVVLGAVSEVTERISGRLAGAEAGHSSALARSGHLRAPADHGPCTSPRDADRVSAVRVTVAAQCDCASARSHGRYMSCVRHSVEAAVREGSLRGACRDDVMTCAARSTCGRDGFATCCRTDKHGKTRCSIKPAGAACKAPHGGTACADSHASCCDACTAGGCALAGRASDATCDCTNPALGEAQT